MYNTATGTWTIDSLATARAFAAATSANNKFIIGGGTTLPFNILSSIEIYTVSSVGLEESDINSDEITVYPNPAQDLISFEIKSNEKNNFIEIYNSLGQIQWSQSAKQGMNSVTITSWPRGIYILRSGNRQQRFVKN